MKRSLFFSFSTLGCPEATWEDAVALAKAHHFSGIELRALKGSIDLPSRLKETFATPEGMAEAVKESGLRVASLDTSLHLLEATEKLWSEVVALASWADALRIPYLRAFDGGTPGSGRDPEIRARLRHSLEVWSSLREKYGFRCELMIETHLALTDPLACILLGREMEEGGRRLHLLWDSCHTWKHSGLDLEKGWELLKPWVRHIHIKDGVRLGEKLGYVLPGEGEIPVLPLLVALDREGFVGPVSLEWERMWNPDLPPLEEALESGRHHGWW